MAGADFGYQFPSRALIALALFLHMVNFFPSFLAVALTLQDTGRQKKETLALIIVII
jgi:hypothetical protein